MRQRLDTPSKLFHSMTTPMTKIACEIITERRIFYSLHVSRRELHVLDHRERKTSCQEGPVILEATISAQVS